MNFLFGPFLLWFPYVMTAFLFGSAVFLYIYRHKLAHSKSRKWLNFTPLIILAVAFRLIYAFLNSWGTYYIWSQSEFTKVFLNQPVSEKVDSFIVWILPSLFQSKLGYFFFYSWSAFWLNAVVILVVAYPFWMFLKFLSKYRERFFDIGEVQLGLAMSLIVGWPNFVIFIPAVCIFMILISIFRGIFFKEPYTTLGWPFIFAGAVAIIAGYFDVLSILNLGYLKI